VFADLTDQLGEIIFQEKLGTIQDKVERIRKICGWLIPNLDFDNRVAEDADRAALLCKNDLLTEMVYEFPNLQGIMGKEYAKNSGENEAVGQGIYEHYLPQHQEGELPQSPVGITLSIADKIDTICGCFGVGLTPTGSADPYALRRQTQGILSILVDQKKHLNLEQLIEISLDTLGEIIKEPEETKSAVLEFFKTRMNTRFNVLTEYRYDLIEAILTHHYKDVLDAQMRIEALSRMCRENYFEPLTTSFKRVVRIIPTEAWDYQLHPDKLAEPAERSLWETFNRIKEKATALLKAREYNKALKVVAGLREDVDRFFDEVLVMTEEEDIRKNRLALLVCLSRFFMQIADFSKIVGEGEKNTKK
jgi:glycyl-tRNA synthetase beta chain